MPTTPSHKALLRKPVRTVNEAIRLQQAILWDACNGLISKDEIPAVMQHAFPPHIEAMLDQWLPTPEGQAAVNEMIASLNLDQLPEDSALRKLLEERFPDRFGPTL
jgi:hypothetical protein